MNKSKSPAKEGARLQLGEVRCCVLVWEGVVSSRGCQRLSVEERSSSS